MRTPILNLTVSLTLIIAIGAVLFALGVPAAIGSAFAWLFSWEMPYITAAITSIAEMYSGFGAAYPAALEAPFTWRPDLLLSALSSFTAYGIAAGYLAANLTVGAALLTATLLLVVALNAAVAFLIGGTAGLRVYAQVLCRKAEAVSLS